MWRDSLHNIRFHDGDSKVVFLEYTSYVLLSGSDALSYVPRAIFVSPKALLKLLIFVNDQIKKDFHRPE